jgi:hypothetical protein
MTDEGTTTFPSRETVLSLSVKITNELELADLLDDDFLWVMDRQADVCVRGNLTNL